LDEPRPKFWRGINTGAKLGFEKPTGTKIGLRRENRYLKALPYLRRALAKDIRQHNVSKQVKVQAKSFMLDIEHLT
jgi:hypothetical protein